MKVTNRASVRGAGFTLVELLVVIGIIGVLASLLIPGALMMKERGNRTSCSSNLRNIAQIATMMAEDKQGLMPFGEQSNSLAYQSFQVFLNLNPELKPDLFICRSAADDVVALKDSEGKFTLEPENVSYAYIKKRMKSTGSKNFPVASDDSMGDSTKNTEGNHTGGMNVAYVGGNVEWVNSPDLPNGLPEGLIGNKVE